MGTYIFDISMKLSKRVEVRADTLEDAEKIVNANADDYRADLLFDGDEVYHDELEIELYYCSEGTNNK
ncbi:MAG: hypothetical protein IJG38_02055 [Thermoguttaceae bacterium]|nr:hypothetical protein [Thermoguttaceae bacterium]